MKNRSTTQDMTRLMDLEEGKLMELRNRSRALECVFHENFYLI